MRDGLNLSNLYEHSKVKSLLGVKMVNQREIPAAGSSQKEGKILYEKEKQINKHRSSIIPREICQNLPETPREEAAEQDRKEQGIGRDQPPRGL